MPAEAGQALPGPGEGAFEGQDAGGLGSGANDAGRPVAECRHQEAGHLWSLLDREPETGRADTVVPHAQHDLIALGVPGETQRDPSLVDEDHLTLRQTAKIVHRWEACGT